MSVNTAHSSKRVIRRLPKTTTHSPIQKFSDRSAPNIPKMSLISHIRDRRSHKIPSMDSQRMKDVVRKYLLPILNSSNPKQPTHKRGKSLCPATHSQLQLTQQIFRERDQFIKQIQELQQGKADLEQHLLSLRYDYQRTQLELMETQSSFKAICTDQEIFQKASQDQRAQSLQKLAEYRQYKQMHKSRTFELKEVNSKLAEQQAINDKLVNRNIDLQYEISLMSLENVIMGEKLKGLYSSIRQLSDHRVGENKLSDEFSLFISQARKAPNQKKGSKSLKKSRKSAEILEIRIKEIEKLVKLNQANMKQIERLTETCKKAISDKLVIQEEFKYIETQLHNVLINLHIASLCQPGEKVCQNCTGVYCESNNMNWSCRRHPALYNGSIYFCCGKMNRQAQGCVISSHQAVQEAIPIFESIVKVNICSSCREVGHTVYYCPNDPNIKTTVTIHQETLRVDMLKQHQSRIQSIDSKNGIRDNMLHMMQHEGWREQKDTQEEPLYTNENQG